MELSVIWVKDLFALHFKCCYWKWRWGWEACGFYKFFFFTWSKWKENFIRLFYWTWPSVCWSSVLPQRTVQHLKGMKVSVFWIIFETIFLTRLCHTSIFTWAPIHYHSQTHKACSIVLIFPKPRRFKPT